MPDAMTARRLLLGDWRPWLRDPIDVLRALLAAGAAGFALAGDGRGALLLGGAPTLYIVLARLDVVPDPKDETHVRHYVGIAVIASALGIALGGLWEIVEWGSDNALGSSLQIDNDDTVGDLIADSGGAISGAALLVCWARWGWGSVRRIPENRFEGTEVAAE
jgi:hypothetical protein